MNKTHPYMKETLDIFITEIKGCNITKNSSNFLYRRNSKDTFFQIKLSSTSNCEQDQLQNTKIPRR